MTTLNLTCFLAITFSCLAIYCQKRLKNYALIIGTVALTSVYYVLGYFFGRQHDFILKLFPIIETIKQILLLLGLNYYLTKEKKITTNMSNLLYPTMIGTVFVSVFLVLKPNSIISTLYPLSGLLLVFIQLWLLEQLKFSFKQEQKTAYALLFALLSTILASVFIYTQNIFIQKLSFNDNLYYLFGMLISLPLWIYHFKRERGQSLPNVSFSRQLTFQTSIFFLASGYLFILSLLAYLFDQDIIQWQNSKNIVFTLLIVSPILTLFFSQRIRGEIWVFINKHFYDNTFDYRSAWISLSEKLNIDMPLKSAYQHGFLSGLSLIDMNEGAYYTCNENFVTMVAKKGLKPSPQLDDDLRRLLPILRENHWILDAHEFKKLNVSQLINANVLWLVPIFVQQQLVGLWLIKKPNHGTWALNWETRDFLFTIAFQMQQYFSRQEQQQHAIENEQLSTFYKTSAFVVHDLKNAFSQVDMILDNATQNKHNPEFIDDVFFTLDGVRNRISKTLTQLQNKELVKNTTNSNICLIDFLPTVIEKVKNPKPSLAFHPKNIPHITVNTDKNKLMNVLLHLINNAQEACRHKTQPSVIIRCILDDNHVKIEITDNGIGMTQQFIDERLFKLFDSTKGNSGMGIGVYDAYKYAIEQKGNLTVRSNLNVGTTFTLFLPHGDLDGTISH